MNSESDHFSPYRTDGKLYGFVCVVTGADRPVGAAVVTELAGRYQTANSSLDMLTMIQRMEQLSYTHATSRLLHPNSPS